MTNLEVKPIESRDGKSRVGGSPKVGKRETSKLAVVKVVVEREGGRKTEVLLRNERWVSEGAGS